MKKKKKKKKRNTTNNKNNDGEIKLELIKIGDNENYNGKDTE